MKSFIRWAAIVAALFLGSVCTAQDTLRIALINSNIPTGKILDSMNDHCQHVVLTTDLKRASYFIEAQMYRQSEDAWLTLFDKDGDALYTSTAVKIGNSVKDICNYLKVGKH